MKRKLLGVVALIVAPVIVFFWSGTSLNSMIAGQRNWSGPWFLLGLTVVVGFGCWALFAPKRV